MRRYLIVDDNLELAENLAEILRDEGAEVVLAGGGHEAMTHVKEGRFDAIVTDMRMPEMGGATVLAQARQLDPGVAAVVVTAFTADDELARARDQGLLAVLPKPVPVSRLLSVLECARRDGIVALVEDDVRLADNLSELLGQRGFTAVTAHSLLETQRLEGFEPFAAIVDVRVPEGPSGEAVRRLRERFPHLPLVVMTGWEQELPDVAVDAVFSKPFASAALVDHVERLHEARKVA